MSSRGVKVGVLGLPRAMENFERYCQGLLDELELSEEVLEKIDSAMKVLRNELNADAYLRILHIWQDSFNYLADAAFDGLGTDQLLIDASKKEMKNALESDWLKRFDIVESVTAQVLLDAEKRFRDNVIETIHESLITQFGLGEVPEHFTGSWVSSLDKERTSKTYSCNFILCENALLTDILYSPDLSSDENEEWWIAPKNARPLMLYFPFGIVDNVLTPSDITHRDGLSTTPFDLKMQLRVEDGIEENRLPYVMNRLRILRHMVVFNEVDINIEIKRDDDESEENYLERKTRIMQHIKHKVHTYQSDDYSVAMIVEGERRNPVSHFLSTILEFSRGRFF